MQQDPFKAGRLARTVSCLLIILFPYGLLVACLYGPESFHLPPYAWWGVWPTAVIALRTLCSSRAAMVAGRM